MTREEAIKELKYIRESFAVNEFSDEAMGMAIKALEEQKTGKWIRESLVTDYPYKCSACKKYSRAMYDFCPNCGAKMGDE